MILLFKSLFYTKLWWETVDCPIVGNFFHCHAVSVTLGNFFGDHLSKGVEARP